MKLKVAFTVLMVALSPVIASAAERTLCAGPQPAETAAAITDLSLEELMNIPVSTVSRRRENSFCASASVHVITNEQIIRSGATNIPEALRLVPGLHVVRQDSNTYTVTSRGFNDLPFSDKLLVLVDGRAVHSPTFSHVWWPAVQYPLEDIDKIEVVLGPGSAMWGANANNGVINIITKSASATKGFLATGGGGNKETGFGSLRYGADIGDAGAIRGYVMGGNRSSDNVIKDEWSDNPKVGRKMKNDKQYMQGGFRADWESAGRKMSLHGDVYDNRVQSEGSVFVSFTEPNTHFTHKDKYSGKNILFKIEQDVSDTLSGAFQLYYDNTNTNRVFFEETLDTYDAEATLDYRLADGHTLSAGLDYRYTRTNFVDTPAIQMPDNNLNLYGFYLQEESYWLGDRLKTTFGAKAEKNNFTSWQLQPSVKVLWDGNSWVLWGAVSRSARLSNPVNSDFTWNWNMDANREVPQVRAMIGTSDSKPESVTAYEAGLRLRPSDTIGFDLSAYYNNYPNVLDIVESGLPYLVSTSPVHTVQALNFLNVYEGSAYGAELTVRLKPLPWLKGYLAYAHTRIAIRPKKGEESHQEEADWINTATPASSFRGSVSADLPYHLKADATLYYVASYVGVSGQQHTRLDLRLAYQPVEHVEIAAIGHNVGTSHYQEYESIFFQEAAWYMPDWLLKLTVTY